MIAIAVLALSAALCLASANAVNGAVTRAGNLLREAETAARHGDTAGALRRVRTMEADWRADGRWLELVTAHDALTEIQGGIADARLCLENGDRHEFLRAGAGVAAALERLSVTEAVRWMNLF